MNNYYGNRLIKIISPNSDEVFSLELDGDERELKELLATLINMPVNSIKGIRDSYGNYFTISSAIHNPNITLNQNTFFTVIINTKRISNDAYLREESDRKKLSPKMTQSQSENTHSTAHYADNITDQKQSSAVVDATDRLFNIDNMSPIRKINQLPSNSSNSSLVNAIDKYHQIALQMINQKIIEEKYFQILKEKLLEENEEVIGLFKQYLRNGNDIEKLRTQLMPILDQSTKCHRDSIYQRFTYSNLINSLTEYFDNPNDITLLHQLLQCDNDMIIKAIEAYDFNHDQQKLINSLQYILKRYRGRFNNSQNGETAENNPNIQNNNFITSILDLKVVDSPQDKSNNKIESTKKITTLKDISQTIEKKLLFDLSALFSYDIETKSIQKVLIEELKINSSQKENIPFDSINQYYKKVLKDNITYDFSIKENELYEELVKTKEKRLIELFNKLKQHKNLDTLSNKIRMLLNKIEEERDIDSSEEEENEEEEEEDDDSMLVSNSESINTSSSNVDASEEDTRKIDVKQSKYESLNKNMIHINQSNKTNKDKDNEREIGGRRNSNSKQTISLHDDIDNKKFADFMKVVNKMAFDENVKKDILQMLSNKNEKMIKIFDNFQRNKMSLTKNVLLQVVKQQQSLAKSNQLKNNIGILKNLNASAHKNKKEESFEEIAKEFLNKKSITQKEYNFLINSFITKDELLYSFWELYLDDPSKDELYESIKMYFAKGSIQKQFDAFQEPSNKSSQLNSKKEGKSVNSKLEEVIKMDSFSELEKQLLREQLRNENQMLLSILEGYESKDDVEDTIESLKILLSKLKNKK